MAPIDLSRSRPPPLSRAERERVVRRVRRLANLLDAAFVLPLVNRRVGMDSIVGLVPGVGDATMTMLSGYIVYEAWRLGVPTPTLLRMAANVAIDFGAGAVPIVGDVIDVMYKANLRNLALIEEHLRLEDHRATAS